ncbi:EAL domain-containing protein [Devosia sp. J2-20]|uniref:EAL domain-containing protein n=1 Tax=Devosia litorisediminis TaxID=2829817 RepID=A0A942EBQ8_9HYPH|nr:MULTISPECIES: EAL domain-containing protein [Devosia]MBS3848404.1 EAL domain-containing protein [Devosia litorisediminis]MCZ4345084.1 EAL domain-containing protein [Devosia neptuniae]WDQ98518.1 EAL domain-containing protein [Devosia sp. J2-20]
MKSRYSHILMLLGAILAFLPIVAVDYLLDAYVRVRERDNAFQYVGTITSQIAVGSHDAIASLRTILADSPSLCTPTFVANVQVAIENSLNMKQVLVENADGVQYCDAFGRNVSFSPLSKALPVPGRTETITLVQFGEMDMPALKITQSFGELRRVSAFVPLLGQTKGSLSEGIDAGGMLRVSLTDGTSIMTIGDPTGFDRRTESTEFIFAQGFAGEMPLKVEYAMPFAMARAGYADLDVSFTIVACLMSAAFLILALNYVRRSRVPAFDLERAIARGEIKPYYQPVINLRTGGLVGCEVLCRWEKKNGEIVPPGAFIDYAEVTGLAIPMTLSLMQQVKYDLSDLCTLMPDMKVAINLFEGHFRDDSIVADVQGIFGNSPVNFRQLVFEITERHPLANSGVANSVIAGLHAMGCKLAMDDAGTGHSNLAYLGTLGIDVIKIDRIFVDMIKPGTTQVPVLDGLIAMAKDLDCEIVAEGVETEAQALYLRARGVVQAQGFIFAPALKNSAFKELAMALHANMAETTQIEAVVASAA